MHFFTLHRGPAYARASRVLMALVCAIRLSVLALALPVVLHPRGARFLRRAWTKWSSILVVVFRMDRDPPSKRGASDATVSIGRILRSSERGRGQRNAVRRKGVTYVFHIA